MLIACIGSVTAVPQACAQCSPETYPGSDICPKACRIVFPADTKWTFPEVDEESNENPFFGDITNEAITSRFMNPDSLQGLPDLMETIESRFMQS